MLKDANNRFFRSITMRRGAFPGFISNGTNTLGSSAGFCGRADHITRNTDRHSTPLTTHNREKKVHIEAWDRKGDVNMAPCLHLSFTSLGPSKTCDLHREDDGSVYLGHGTRRSGRILRRGSASELTRTRCFERPNRRHPLGRHFAVSTQDDGPCRGFHAGLLGGHAQLLRVNATLLGGGTPPIICETRLASTPRIIRP